MFLHIYLEEKIHIIYETFSMYNYYTFNFLYVHHLRILMYKEKVNFLLVRENPEMSYTRRKFANTRRKFDVHGGSLLNNNIYMETFDRHGENRQP